MKRLFLIILCFALVITLCPQGYASYTTSDDQAIAGPFLYVIPNFQASVLYAYFINSSGVSTVPWPGEMMRRIGNTYEVVLPPDTVGLVIQTGDGDPIYRSGRLDIMPNVDVWISVSVGGEVISYDGPAEAPVPTEPTVPAPTEPAVRMRTLSVQTSGRIDTLRVYSEDSQGNKPFGNYPGALLSQQDGWFKISIPADLDMLILVQNIQSSEPGLVPRQTDQLQLQPDQDIWITLAEDMTTVIRYGSPDAETTRPEASTQPQGQPSEYRVVGNADFFGNWDPANDQGVMIEIAPGVYKKQFKDVPPGDYEIVITKDGSWDQSWNDNGSNFCFTITDRATITVTFTLIDGVGVISVKGHGVPATGGDDDPEPTNPTHTLPTEPFPTEPIATEPLLTEPVEEPTVPTDTEKDPTDPPISGDAAPDVNEPADADSAQVSPLVNLPIYSLNLFFIGMVCVALYLLFLLRKRKKERAAMILGGTIVQAGSLSLKATEDLVKDNPVQPSSELDEAVMKAIKDIEEKQ